MQSHIDDRRARNVWHLIFGKIPDENCLFPIKTA